MSQAQQDKYNLIHTNIQDLFSIKERWMASEILDELNKRGISVVRQTVYNHMKKIVEEWKSQIENEQGIKFFGTIKEGQYWKRPYYRVFNKIPDEIKAILQTREVSSVFRPNMSEIGTIYLITDPEMSGAISWGLVSKHESDFLSNNPYWIRDIFRYLLREKIIDEDYFSGKKKIVDLSDNDIEKMWSRLFGDTKLYITIFAINSKKLLEHLKTPEGKRDLVRALPEKIRKNLYNEASKLWHERDAWAQRLKIS